MKLLTIIVLAFLLLAPAVTFAQPFTIPQPSPCTIPTSSERSSEDPFPSEEPLFPAPSDAFPLDEPPLTTDAPSFQIITCVNFSGCNIGFGQRVTCTNAQVDIRPDSDSFVLLLSQRDQFGGSRITYRARVPVTPISTERVISSIPWVSTESDVEPTVCVSIPEATLPAESFESFSIGAPFGTCCRACSFTNGVGFPPRISCCRAC